VIRRVPDPILREVCHPVLPGSPEAKDTADALRAEFRAQGGRMAGLAAPQVGYTARVVLLNVKGEPKIYLNPEIEEMFDRVVSTEGCLSIPGATDAPAQFKVPRCANVVFRAQDEAGNETRMLAYGMESIALQHEIDHLNGKLITDYRTQIGNDRTHNRSE